MRFAPLLLALCSLDAGCSRPANSPTTPPTERRDVPPGDVQGRDALTSAPQAWLRGQTHVHSNRSGDSNTPPEQVIAWYAQHAFDFIVFTDHNRVTRPPVASQGRLMVFSGAEITWNSRTCGPPDAPCTLHTNALFIPAPDADLGVSLSPANADDRTSVYDNEFDITQQFKGIAQLNHPNFNYGAGVDVIVHLAGRGVRLVEFSNASDGVQNEGDALHVDTEQLWNQVLSRGVNVWNVASDDAHHYNDVAETRAAGEPAYPPGLGWVMVQAERDGSSIRDALTRGRFYSSTGPTLTSISARDGAYTLTVDPAARVQFIAAPGDVVQTSQGPTARLAYASLPARADWVRAVVEDASGKRAWTQPVRLVRNGARVESRGPFGDIE